MAIYTKTGDKGETSLANGERVSKTDVRVEAYGTVDELNSFVGLLRLSYYWKHTADELKWIQNRLFNLGAALSEAPGEWITDADVSKIEEWIDEMQSYTPKQQAFVLPYGNEAVCRCHICRTVCRRAERRMIEAGVTGTNMEFINRLSDYFFVLSRYTTHHLSDVDTEWEKDYNVEKLTE